MSSSDASSSPASSSSSSGVPTITPASLVPDGPGDLQIIETGDALKVKQVLDECLQKAVRNSGYTINHRGDNTKLLIMVLGCVCGATAQFYPAPFPQSIPILTACCIAYLLLTGLMQFIVTFIDGDRVLVTHPREDKQGGALCLRATFEKYQEFYVLTAEAGDAAASKTSTAAGKGGNKADKKAVVARMYVGRYFTERGEFDEEGFLMDAMTVVALYRAGRFQEVEFNHGSASFTPATTTNKKKSD